MVITSSIFDAEKPSEEEESDIVVPRLEKASKTTELVLSTNQLQEKDGKKFLSLTSGPEELFRVDFITEGWRRLNSHDMESCKLSFEKEIVGDVDIYPDISKDDTEWYTIDSERFEAGPVSVTLLPNKLKFFYQPRNSESESSNLEIQR
ncbi:putative acylglycerol kinase, mitochondrial [Apostichopus japonicus]|uniref:Putative acylglycerol kinase, mitochondrial n=1 Tax=Stichopus japonicus TaxID=307972 RepID=A0A2G8KI22_STIJA|nr:putative acylglycerol kinase, mitochondrial [Apostichopus japonicus]